jgi:hypothetical protein
MTWTSLQLPTTNSTIDTTGNPWINPNNAHTDDANYAQCDAVKNTNNETDRWATFDFSEIPDGSLINGIEVTIDIDTETADDSDPFVNLYDATNGVSTTTEEIPSSTTRQDRVLGGATSLWGETEFLAADIKASTFGVQVYCYNDFQFGNRWVRIFSIYVRVDYTAPLVVPSRRIVHCE